jgi:hypothetical protein
MAETADRPTFNGGRFGSIRKSELADSAGVAANSNRTRCRLEIETAWLVRECWVPIVEQEIVGGQPARQAIPRVQNCCLGTIRKSELIDLARVARNFNCTRCRLEIVGGGAVRERLVPLVARKMGRGQPARQAILRACRLEILRRNTDERCGKYVGAAGARIGEVPGMVRPAARESRPRSMCVW